MKNPLVNIIIVTFNEYTYTKQCLQSVLKSTYKNIKIYLVDNGSEEKVYKNFFKKNRNNKKIELIRLPNNKGFGAGCNEALRKIKKGYIVFLNNDTQVEKKWLEPLVDYMETHPKIGACQPKIKDLKRKNYFEYAGAAGGFMDIYGFPFSRGRIFYTLEKDKGQYDNFTQLVWCSGTAMITHTKILKKIGLFDEIFFMYGEEADMCWKIHHAGYKMIFHPGSTIYHKGGGTMSKFPKEKKTFFSHRNGLIMLIKNYSIKECIFYFPVRILLDSIAFLYYFITHHRENSIAICKAYIDLLRLLPKVIKGRIETNRLKRKYKRFVLAPYPLYKKSIIFDYFLFGKKKFTQLKYEI